MQRNHTNRRHVKDNKKAKQILSEFHSVKKKSKAAGLLLSASVLSPLEVGIMVSTKGFPGEK